MKLLQYLILLLLSLHTACIADEKQSSETHLLVGNEIDREIARDIKTALSGQINLVVSNGNNIKNIERVLSDEKAQFAIVPHDYLLYIRDVKGQHDLANKIKLVMPLYDKNIYIIVRKDGEIKSVADMNNKKVNIYLGEDILSATGEIIKRKNNISWIESHDKQELAMEKLLAGDIDAMILIEKKPSLLLSKMTQLDSNRIKFISPQLNGDYPRTYINESDYPWVLSEVESNQVNVVLISYNYQENKSIDRFSTYIENIKKIIDYTVKNMSQIIKKGHPYWADIAALSYKKVDWPLHDIAKKTILENLGKLDSFTNTYGMKFISIPKGTFLLGSSDKTLPSDERPQKKLDIDSFYILETEVTQKQWRDVMGSDESTFASNKSGYYSWYNPASRISYDDAIKFIDTLNHNEKRGNYRLPSEQEWEYAAGDDEENLEYYAWYAANGDNQTHKVAQKYPNKWGLYDMLGNVWEWTESRYTDSYDEGSKESDFRVLRGGSYLNLRENTRVKNRMPNTEAIRYAQNGFRVVYDKSSKISRNTYYTVRVGDTLRLISQKFYKDSSKWNVIFYGNRDTIGKNPSNIHAGQRLKIPKMHKFSFKEDAVRSDKKVTKNAIKLLSAVDFKPFLGPSLPRGGMANHIVEELFHVQDDDDYKITWNNDFSTHFALLKNLEYDVGVAWYKPDCSNKNKGAETTLRCELLFSDQIFEAITALYRNSTGDTKLIDTKDLYHHRICRPKGIYTFDLEDKGLIDNDTITLVRPKTKKECFEMLLEKKVDYVALDNFSGDAIIKEMKIGGMVESVESVATLVGMHLVIHRKNPRAKEILNKLNKGIEILRDTGELDEIQAGHLSNFFNSIELDKLDNERVILK